MDNKIVKVAAYIIVGSVVLPIVGGIAASAIVGIDKLQAKIRFNHKIKKGLKDGSVVEIDGEYYEVQVEQ